MTSSALFAPYPEQLRMTERGQLELEVSLPQAWHVVMGAAGKPEQEVDLEALARHGVPLYKRKGGGGTVLLGPGTLVVTVHAGVAHPFRNLAYFAAINRALMAVFANWAPLPYHQRGISDIAVGDHKIVGSSIYRSRQYLLYQASILVDFDLALMAVLLRHPPREPDYRQGRSHGSFLTNLRALGIALPEARLAEDLRSQLPALLRARLVEVDTTPEG